MRPVTSGRPKAGRKLPLHLTNQDNQPPASLTNSLLIAEKLTLQQGESGAYFIKTVKMTLL